MEGRGIAIGRVVRVEELELGPELPGKQDRSPTRITQVC